MSDFICQKYTDCSSCSLYQKQLFKYRSYFKGMIIPKERCSQNTIYFLISGRVQVNSEEHPGTVFHDGQFIMQPIGSRVEFRILEQTECILYLFETPKSICTERYNRGLELAKESPMEPIVMEMCFPLRLFINGLKMYLNNDLLCAELLKAKQTELYFLLNCYYTIKEIAAFYAPIYRYSKTFRYFVMQNYLKAKDVESFAQLGGYSTPTFRRLFKDTFGEPAYQWMVKKKCQDIQSDLITTDISISEICYKYGFESLSNFSHFCRANFGKSPRAIRNERGENL
ncbi:AraC family transcriptional regulator [uncultured Parabacteroides sp.]|uniref:helix-turn-helix domain-containing protein n=1 Tax=uncultured Parabacteroides sp. TaxID=512312 RepID=UPI0025CDD0D2|nr:AraC family transcriptional regulator [uncultured Parabacteroides sp.]